MSLRKPTPPSTAKIPHAAADLVRFEDQEEPASTSEVPAETKKTAFKTAFKTPTKRVIRLDTTPSSLRLPKRPKYGSRPGTAGQKPGGV